MEVLVRHFKASKTNNSVKIDMLKNLEFKFQRKHHKNGPIKEE